MDPGGKRCLPTWMFKRSAHEELQESGNGESQFPLQGQSSIQASLQKMKAIDQEDVEESPRQEAKKLDENPVSLFLSETRKKPRKSSGLYVNPRTTSCNKSGSGRKKASDRKAAHNRSAMRARSGCEKLKQPIDQSWPENDVKLERLRPTRSEGDVGLTVEDLMSIAEEYVNADKEKKHRQKANEEFKSETHNPSSSVFPKDVFGVLCGAAQSSGQISMCTTTTYGSYSSATDMMENAPSSISRTGDAALDMLDVFLGPLLKIPNERKLEGTQKEELATPCEFSVLHSDDIARDKESHYKRKSTLKHRVATFLTDSERTSAP